MLSIERLNRRVAHGRVRALVVAVVALAFLASPNVGSAFADRRPEAGARQLTAQERERLSAGELVTRPADSNQGSTELVGGVSYQVIQAPPHVVWQALVDAPHYHRMMPRLLEARVMEQSTTRRKLLMRQGQAGLLEMSYFLDVDYDRTAGDIRFRMDDSRPHDLEAAWGFYNVRPYGERTLLTYGIMADLGGGILTRMLRDSVQTWMLKTPWMVKRFVEGSGRWLYDWRAPEPRS